MVKINLKKIKDNIALKRFLITLVLTISVAMFYFNLFKFLETPKLNLIKKFEISNMFVWIDKSIRNNSYFYLERTYEYRVDYPYIIKKSLYCYNLPKTGKIFTKEGEKIQIVHMNNKICIPSDIREFIIKDFEKKSLHEYVRISQVKDSYKVFIKNLDEFPLNLEIRIDVKKLINREADVYRDGTIVAINTSYFFDSKVIAPYGNLEYEIK